MRQTTHLPATVRVSLIYHFYVDSRRFLLFSRVACCTASLRTSLSQRFHLFSFLCRSRHPVCSKHAYAYPLPVLRTNSVCLFSFVGFNFYLLVWSSFFTSFPHYTPFSFFAREHLTTILLSAKHKLCSVSHCAGMEWILGCLIGVAANSRSRSHI